MSTNTIKLDKEVDAIIKRLKRARESMYTKEFEEAIDESAKLVVAAARASAPEGDEPHARYSTAKVDKKRRAPKGKGTVVATYFPGNLKRSIQVLKKLSGKLSRTIGPRRFKGSPKGDFKGRRVDGFYAHMVHDGTEKMPADPYMERAAKQTAQPVKTILINAARRVIKNGFKK